MNNETKLNHINNSINLDHDLSYMTVIGDDGPDIEHYKCEKCRILFRVSNINDYIKLILSKCNGYSECIRCGINCECEE